jgi:hypothetical protein
MGLGQGPRRRVLAVRLPLRIFLFVSLSVATLAPIAYLGPAEVARWREVQGQASDQALQLAAESLARAIGQAIAESVRGITTMANHVGTYGTFGATAERAPSVLPDVSVVPRRQHL